MIDLRHTGNLLYISSADVSIGNGPGVNEREFIIALHRALGDRAHFLIPRPLQNVTDIPFDACTLCRPHHCHSMKHYPVHILSQMRMAHQLLSKRHFDLLLFRLDVLPIAPLYITRMFNHPFALKTLGHNLLKALADRGGWFGRSLAGINRRLVKGLVRKAVVADSVSPIQIDFLRERLDLDSNKLVWIDNAVNTERFRVESTSEARLQLGLSRFDRLVGYVGTRPWERGGMQLVEAAARVIHKYPGLGVVILGDGAGVQDLERRAHELDISENCVFPGYVPFHQVPTYVNSLDLGVSLNLLESREASSELKVRQYLACGKPVVASPGGNDFLVSAGLGSIVPPNDIDLIAQAIDRWLALNPQDRSDFAEKASTYTACNLSVDSATDQRLELWTERLQSLAPQLS